MSVLLIAHGRIGRRVVTRLGALGTAVAPALDLLLEDAFAAVAASASATEQTVAAESRAADEESPAVVPDAIPVSQVVACRLDVEAYGPDEEQAAVGAGQVDPFADAPYRLIDLDGDGGASGVADLVGDHLRHELQHAGDPGLLLLLDLRSEGGVTAARQLSESVERASAELPAAFMARRIVTVNILPESERAGGRVEPVGWGSCVTLLLTEHSADAESRERLETDESLAELLAALACGVESEAARDELFAWTSQREADSRLRHAAVGLRAVVAGQDSAGKATQLALGMSRIATQAHNEHALAGVDSVETWPARIGLEAKVVVGRILERPSMAPGPGDMREAFGEPQEPEWTELDAGRWIIMLRDLRRRSLLDPGMAVAERARANAQTWRTEILAKLGDLVDETVEHTYSSLPDAAFVLDEFDDALSRATVRGELDTSAGDALDGSLDDLRAGLERLPHVQALRTRYALAGAAAAVPLALMLPGVLPGVPGIAVRVAALILGVLAGLGVAALHQRRRERDLVARRNRAMADLGAWLKADLEKLVENEVARGISQLREAMEDIHRPALDAFIDANGLVERALQHEVGRVSLAYRVRSITDLTGVEVPARGGRDPERETRRFMNDHLGRDGWRSLAALDVGRRVLGHARDAVLPVRPDESDTLEAVMAEVFAPATSPEDEKAITAFLAGAGQELVVDRRQVGAGQWSGEASRLLLTSEVQCPVWNEYYAAQQIVEWDPARQMAIHLRVEWEEPV